MIFELTLYSKSGRLNKFNLSVDLQASKAGRFIDSSNTFVYTTKYYEWPALLLLLNFYLEPVKDDEF